MSIPIHLLVRNGYDQIICSLVTVMFGLGAVSGFAADAMKKDEMKTEEKAETKKEEMKKDEVKK